MELVTPCGDEETFVRFSINDIKCQFSIQNNEVVIHADGGYIVSYTNKDGGKIRLQIEKNKQV